MTHTLYIVLMVLALFCFLLAGFNISSPRINFIGLGLALAAAAVLMAVH